MQRLHKYLAAFVLCFGILAGVRWALRANIAQVPTGTWAVQSPLAQGRTAAAAALLPDGRVLVTGGADLTGAPLATAEFFNSDGTFTPAPAMSFARMGHTATVLQDGRVLVAGGTAATGSATQTAELFDPAANAWSTAGPLMVARSGHTATLLQKGQVLIAGGSALGAALASLELFDPTQNTFTLAAAPLSTPRENHAAALLQDGRVIIVGGWDGTTLAPVPPATTGNMNVLASSDIIDPVAGIATPGPALAVARMNATATTGLDGKVAVIGGSTGQADLASIEVFDPTATPLTFTLASSALTTARSGHLAFLLPHNGNILVVGGTSSGAAIASAELYTPWTGVTSATGALGSARALAVGSPLSGSYQAKPFGIDGMLMMAGGQDASASTLASSEVYGFATVKTDKGDYEPGSTVTITGTGWVPGETVTLSFLESPYFDTHPSLTAVADVDGKISNSQFSPDIHDLNIMFYLTAVGSASQAQTTFTDKPAVHFVTSAFTANPSTCSPPIIIQTPSVTGELVGLATSSAGGAFYSDAACTTAITQITTSTTHPPRATFYYKDSNAGSPTITVTDLGSGGLNTNTQVETISNTAIATTTTLVVNPASAQYNVSTTVTLTATLTRNDTSAGLNGATIDFIVNGTDLGTATTATVGGHAGIASITFNPASFPNDVPPPPTIALPPGVYPATAEFSGGPVGPNTYAASSGNGTLTITGATQLGFTTNPVSGNSGDCLGPITIQTQTSGGVQVNPSSTLTVNLGSTSLGGAFFSDSGCATSITTVTIPATGSPTATFYYKDSNAGTPTITASAAGYTSATQVENINAVPTTLTLSPPSPASVSQGSAGPVTFTAVLTRTTGGAAVVGATIHFTVDGTDVGTTATTDSTGTATLTTYNPSALAPGSHNVVASFAAATISSVSYAAATSNTQTLKVTAAITVNTSVAGLTFTVDGTPYTTPQTFQWDPTSLHTISTTSPQAGAAGVQYVWTDWSDAGAISHQVTTPSIATTYTANFKTQYQITFDESGMTGDQTGTLVTVNGSPRTTLPYAAYYDSGSSLTYGYTSPVTTGSASKQYRWNSTSGLSQTLQTNSFTVSATGTVTGNYVAQFKVVFDASANVKGDSTATIVTVDGSGEAGSALPFGKFVDSGSTVMYAYASPVASAAAPTTTQYRWNATSGLSQTLQTNTFTVSGAGTVIGNYVTQFKVVFDASANVKGDSTATIVTVDGSGQAGGALPFSKFVDSGVTVMYGYASPVASAAAPTTTQYRWDSTSGLGQTLQGNTFTVSGGGTVIGNYVAQFKVTFDASANVKSDSTATIVTVGGSGKAAGALPFTTDFLDSGSSLTYSYASPVASTAAPTTTQYRWGSTSGLGQTLQGNTFSVSGAGTVIGNYVAQFKVTFDASANVKGDSTATIVTVGGSGKAAGALPFTTDFMDSGSSLTYSYASPVASAAAPTTTQYRWNTTSGVGQTLQANTFNVSAGGTVIGNYTEQFQLTLAITAGVPGGLANITGGTTGTFYDSGTVLSLTAATPVPVTTGTQWRFNNWTGTVPTSTSNPSSVTMNAPESVMANYIEQYQITFAQSGMTGDQIGTIVTVNGSPQSALPYSAYYDSGSMVTYAYSSPVATTTAGKRYALNTPAPSPASGFTVSSVLTVTGTYKTQWLLTLAVTPNVAALSGAISGGISGTYYDDGTPLTLTAAASVMSGATGYVFQSWSGDTSPGTASANQLSFTIHQPRSITANYSTVLIAWDPSSVFTGQYSDPTGLVADVTINGSPQSGLAVTFSVGTDVGYGTTNASGVAAESTTYTLTQAPGSYTATASCPAAACGVLISVTNSYTINQEDAQITYTGLPTFSTSGSSVTVALSYTLQDATATGVGSPIYDPYAGDITKAKVTITLAGVAPAFSGSCSALPVIAVPGEVDPTNHLPSTGTVVCTINNVPVPGAFNATATPAAGSYYTFWGDTNVSIGTANGGTGFITGGSFQTAAYLGTPGASGSGKYTTAGLLKPAPNTKLHIAFETKYNKSGSNLQGGANIIVHSACVAGIAGYTPTPGDDGFCVYQIKTNGNGNITSLSETLTPKPPNAVFTARNVTISDVTRPIPLLVVSNASLQLNMYDVGEPGANVDTLAIQVSDATHGLWLSNNWNGVMTVISGTTPVINGGNLQVH